MKKIMEFAISKYLKNIFYEGELEAQVVVSKMEITTPHGEIDGKTQTMEAKNIRQSSAKTDLK